MHGFFLLAFFFPSCSSTAHEANKGIPELTSKIDEDETGPARPGLGLAFAKGKCGHVRLGGRPLPSTTWPFSRGTDQTDWMRGRERESVCVCSQRVAAHCPTNEPLKRYTHSLQVVGRTPPPLPRLLDGNHHWRRQGTGYDANEAQTPHRDFFFFPLLSSRGSRGPVWAPHPTYPPPPSLFGAIPRVTIRLSLFSCKDCNKQDTPTASVLIAALRSATARPGSGRRREGAAKGKKKRFTVGCQSEPCAGSCSTNARSFEALLGGKYIWGGGVGNGGGQRNPRSEVSEA